MTGTHRSCLPPSCDQKPPDRSPGAVLTQSDVPQEPPWDSCSTFRKGSNPSAVPTFGRETQPQQHEHLHRTGRQTVTGTCLHTTLGTQIVLVYGTCFGTRRTQLMVCW